MKLYNGMGKEVTGDYSPKTDIDALHAELDALKAENLKLKRVKPKGE